MDKILSWLKGLLMLGLFGIWIAICIYAVVYGWNWWKKFFMALFGRGEYPEEWLRKIAERIKEYKRRSEIIKQRKKGY